MILTLKSKNQKKIGHVFLRLFTWNHPLVLLSASVERFFVSGRQDFRQSFWTGLAPLITGPPPTSFTTLSKKNVTCYVWHITCDKWQVTYDKWQVGGGKHSLKISALTVWELKVTCDTWHMTREKLHTGDDEHCVNISGPYLLWFGCEGVLKFLNERMTQLINDKGVCRTAPAT